MSRPSQNPFRNREAGRPPQRQVWLTGLLLAAAAVLISAVAFVGLGPAVSPLLPGQKARHGVTSDLQFSYESPLLTAESRRQARDRVAPVFATDLTVAEAYATHIRTLTTAADVDPPDLTSRAAPERLNSFAAWRKRLPPPAPAVTSLPTDADWVEFLGQIPPGNRAAVADEGLRVLMEISQQGITGADWNSQAGPLRPGEVSGFNIQSAERRPIRFHSRAEALSDLLAEVRALPQPAQVQAALLRLLRHGVVPNMAFQAQRTEDLRLAAARATVPVAVSIAPGQTIISPEQRVTGFEIEALDAFRREHARSEATRFAGDILSERLVLILVLLLGVALAARSGRFGLSAQRHRLGVGIAGLILHTTLARVMVEVSQIFPDLFPLLPYLLPTLVAPILVSLLAGAAAGMFVGVVGAVICSLMMGDSLPFFILHSVAALLAIHYCRRSQSRARLLRAALIGGLALALYAVFAGLREGQDLSILGLQGLAALATSLVCGVVVVGLLPVFEGVFKVSTDISLLELTNSNHPLLQRLQLEAPGTYHHSLMVAQLAERAASEIGVNPLACRVAALYHDIGKLARPEYFTENQQGADNPLLRQNPSMSALVIKAHVREGLELAREAKLPPLVLDTISQHHGTTLIQYFYYRAVHAPKATFATVPNSPAVELDPVSEQTFRYEGPRPRRREAALIFLADSIEAASRSLPKMSPQAVEDLIQSIFHNRLEDNQLDECPMTFQELDLVRKSFARTILTMHHGRTAYPKDKAE